MSRNFCCAVYGRAFDQLASPSDGTGIQITLKSGTTAAAFDVFNVTVGDEAGSLGGAVDIVIGGKKYAGSTPSAPNYVFVGFVSTAPVSSLMVTAQQPHNLQVTANIMNFAFGSSTSAPPSSVVLQSSANPSVLGQAVTLAAILPANGSGKVTFLDGVTPFGSAMALSGKATLVTSLLPSGVHRLTARYSGDGALNYQPGLSPPLSQTVAALGQNGFLPKTTSTSGVSAPRFLAVGDFNHDGNPDLAVANYDIDTVSIFLGKGDGTFQPPVSYGLGTGRGPVWIAVTDFDADGNADLVVATDAVANSTVALLRGNGDGTFRPAVNYAAGIGSESIAVADFDGDGQPDLVVANSSSNSVSVLLGNSSSGAVNYAAGPSPTAVTVGDFNEDGKADLAVSNALNNTVGIFFGNGDGTFKSAVNISVGPHPAFLISADFDGDGRTDLATVNTANDTISVLLGKGDGTFKPAVTYTVSQGVRSLAVGDFNGDGVADLVAVDSDSNSVNVLLGNGDGTFQAPVTYDVGAKPMAVAVGDFNGDGRSDIVVANFAPSGISILLGTPLVADLTIAKSHSGDFAQGQVGASYAIAVSNLGPGPSSGAVTVADTLPAGLTATAIAGDGWTCVLSTVTCTRRDSLPAGSQYPSIAITVNVAPDAAGTVINTALVSGGGDSNLSNNSAMDPANVTAALSIATTALDAGSLGTAYSFALAAAGGTPPYVWSLVDGTLPDGLVFASDTGMISGTPTTLGDSMFAVSVTDAAGATASQTFTLTITASMAPKSVGLRMRR